jgi:hypothetical protein
MQDCLLVAHDSDDRSLDARNIVAFGLPSTSLTDNDSELTGTAKFPDAGVGLAKNACSAVQAGSNTTATDCTSASTGIGLKNSSQASNRLINYDQKYCLHILPCSNDFPEGYLCERSGYTPSINMTIPLVGNMRDRVYSSLLYSSMIHNYCVAGNSQNLTGNVFYSVTAIDRVTTISDMSQYTTRKPLLSPLSEPLTTCRPERRFLAYMSATREPCATL